MEKALKEQTIFKKNGKEGQLEENSEKEGTKGQAMLRGSLKDPCENLYFQSQIN